MYQLGYNQPFYSNYLSMTDIIKADNKPRYFISVDKSDQIITL